VKFNIFFPNGSYFIFEHLINVAFTIVNSCHLVGNHELRLSSGSASFCRELLKATGGLEPGRTSFISFIIVTISFLFSYFCFLLVFY
jgi:hypothetical protein